MHVSLGADVGAGYSTAIAIVSPPHLASGVAAAIFGCYMGGLEGGSQSCMYCSHWPFAGQEGLGG